jgi:cysteine desulfurase
MYRNKISLECKTKILSNINSKFFKRSYFSTKNETSNTSDLKANDLIPKINMSLKNNTIFFDFQSTTPLDPRVLDAMLPYQTLKFGNPHSKSHEYGWEAEKAVEDARENIAKLIKADSKEIIFTSGATESNNTALKGVAQFYKEKKKHIITTQTVFKFLLLGA